MRDILVKIIQAGLRPFGAKIARRHLEREEAYRAVRVASEIKAACILDVGANMGQFAQAVIHCGWGGKIISFEPLGEEFKVLCEKAKAHPDWIVAPRGAVGDYSGETIIYRAGNSASSSLLTMRNEHIDAAQESVTVGRETITIRRLDQFDLIPVVESLFLKIDTQGFEMSVLKGAAGIMPQIKGMLVEISFEHLYENQAQGDEIIDYLMRQGFKLHDMIPCFYHPKSGRMLQANIIVIRR